MLSYARRDLLRNPRRTIASMIGIVLGVGLFSGVLFFIDGSGASMTKRALAPVSIDMQRVLTAPLGPSIGLTQRLLGGGPLSAGQQATMTLTVRNLSPDKANEVVVVDKLAPGLSYVGGSAMTGSRPVRDPGGQSPFDHGPGGIGHNVGSVAAGDTVRLSYRVEAAKRVGDRSAVELGGTISSREQLAPERSNGAGLITVDALQRRIAAVPGVSSSDVLDFAQLKPGSLSAGGSTIVRPIKIFGFDLGYVDQYPTITISQGGLSRGGAMLSPEAARSLGVGVGERVSLTLPATSKPVRLKISGIVDLSRARPLFNSRQGAKLEDFLYIPDSIVLSPQAFQRIVVPAFRSAAAARGRALAVKAPPNVEVDVGLDRGPLQSDPARALAQTQAVARQVKRIAPGQDYLLDNASNTLTVAKADSRVAKRMFLFLGLPGLLLAAFLAAYAGAILAAAQRRDQAKLRLRGANRRQLAKILLYRTAALAGIGSLIGTLAGFASVLVVLDPSALFEASAAHLLVSAAISLVAGIATTAIALYIPGRAALRREVSGERREMAVEVEPAWRRLRLDFVAFALATAAVVLAVRGNAFDAPAGAVSTGQSTSLNSQLLLLPLGAWFAGTLLSTRVFGTLARRLHVPAPPRFGSLLRGVLNRSLSRRPKPLLTGIVGLALVVAFGVGLTVFGSTYSGAKQADARFSVGSDLRVAPSPLDPTPHPASFADKLVGGGVSDATPVVASLENAFVRSIANSDAKDLAAIDPASFARTAALSDSFFPDSSASAAMRKLAADPKNILLDPGTADDLKLKVGDTVEILFARGTRQQQLRTMKVAGLFDRFPGFPEGLNVVANLDYFQSQTQIKKIDFFLAKTDSSGPDALARATDAISGGQGPGQRLDISSTETSYNKDQSSLTALNVRGLLDLNSAFTLLICATVIAIFVFGLMLQRRREYIVMRAQGLSAPELRALVLGEAAFVGIGGLVAGAVIGLVLGSLLVHVLEPLFILSPQTSLGVADQLILAGLVATATVLSALSALLVLRSLRPSEILRDV